MPKPMLALFLFNGFAGITLALVAQYFALFSNTTSQHDEQIEYLRNKVCQLEKQLHNLQQNLEDMEERMTKKDTALIESSQQLHSKLEDFINYNYEVVD
ncbi:MAG: hypothetical protein EBU90_09080 [Proteobacteria bacterium]|nr:hypothetical protein [Pseudomonadota bacterium]NBP13618.1 hypothetical protein [bacterium]